MDLNAAKGSRRTIVAQFLSDELNTKPVILEHFSKFGDIERVSCSKKNKYALIQFVRSEDALAAKNSDGVIQPGHKPSKIQWSGKSPTTLKISPKLISTTSSSMSSQLSPFTFKRTPTSPTHPRRLSLQSSNSSGFDDSDNSNAGGSVLQRPKLNAAKSRMSILSHLSSNRVKKRPSTIPTQAEISAAFADKRKESDQHQHQPIPKLDNKDGESDFEIPDDDEETDLHTESEKSRLRSATATTSIVKTSKPFEFESKALIPMAIAKSEKSSPINSNPFMKIFGGGASIIPSMPSAQLQIKKAPAPEIKTNKIEKRDLVVKSIDKTSTTKLDAKAIQDLISKKAFTAEERYRLLDLRDKYIRQKHPRGKLSVKNATNLKGNCIDMCPEKERYMREFQRTLSRYELQKGKDHEVDHATAIKAYSRSSADQEEPLPHELRTGASLQMTMNYILHKIIPQLDEYPDEISDWYNFVWDRTRGIRKDITQQQICDLSTIDLLEKCTRFHIICSSRLCELDRNEFVPKFNDENLMKCLQSLDHMYSDLKRKGISCPNEAEFRSYQILMNLNEGEILANLQSGDLNILKNDQVRLALKAHMFVFQNNFVGFFRLVKSSPFLTSCILHRYFFQIRTVAIRSMKKATIKSGGAMPFSIACRMLGYSPGTFKGSSPLFEYLCEFYAIKVDYTKDRIYFTNSSIQNTQSTESPLIFRENNLIESKLETSIAEAINGQPLDPYIEHETKSSFNSHGSLIPEEFEILMRACIDETASRSTEDIQQSNKPQIFNFAPRQPTQLQASPIVDIHKKLKEDEERKKQRTLQYVEMLSYNAIEEITSTFVQEELSKIIREIEMELLIEREAILKKERIENRASYFASSLYQEIEQKFIQESLSKVALEEIRRKQEIEKTTHNFAENLVNKFLDDCCNELSYPISTEVYKESLNEHAHNIRNLKAIGQKMEMRFWFEKWRTGVKKQKEQTFEREQKRIKLMEDFPSTSSFLPNNEAILLSWCGPDALKSSPKEGIFFVPEICEKLKRRIRRSETSKEEEVQKNDMIFIPEQVVKNQVFMDSFNFQSSAEDPFLPNLTDMELQHKWNKTSPNNYTQTERLTNLFIKRNWND